MTKDTISSLSVYRVTRKKWELIAEFPQGMRAEIAAFLALAGAAEIGRKYTDEAAYHFYMVFDMPAVKE